MRCILERDAENKKGDRGHLLTVLITGKENWRVMFPEAKCLVIFPVTSFVSVKGSCCSIVVAAAS